jgi:hypothetical protein
VLTLPLDHDWNKAHYEAVLPRSQVQGLSGEVRHDLRNIALPEGEAFVTARAAERVDNEFIWGRGLPLLDLRRRGRLTTKTPGLRQWSKMA